MKRSAPFGDWQSPITPDLLASEKVWLRNSLLAGGEAFWLRVRAADQGRFVVVSKEVGKPAVEVTPIGFSARSMVNEYGGGRYTIAAGMIYFSNFPDHRVYQQSVAGGEPRPITPPGSCRYADFSFDDRFQRLFCVCEDHSPGDPQPAQSIVLIDPHARSVTPVVTGADFYAYPRIHPQGTRLAWISWNHPFMPWDEATLWTADILPDGSLGERTKIAGGAGVSIFQPEWSPDGVLYFVSDQNGWWNLYRETSGTSEPVLEMEAEFGQPLWQLGHTTYAFETSQILYCAYNRQGFWKLARLDLQRRELKELDLPFTDFSSVRAEPGKVICIAGSPSLPECVVLYDTTSGAYEILDRALSLPLDPSCLSKPQPISFPAEDGQAHAFYYPPTNNDYQPETGKLPPLIVTAHGGPTDSARTLLNLDIQFWTSRGFALVDVNYGGSTGYGSSYRNRLYGSWGIVDVQDCLRAARYLIDLKLVDPERVVVRGHSAGGFTALESLIGSSLYKAGAIFFGISDLEGMVKTTHKFESHYNIRLVAPYPERLDVYRERSPLYHAEQIDVPVIFFQGLLDRVVPPDQTQRMVDVMNARNIPVSLVTFSDEYHGFLLADNLKRCYEEECAFYQRVLSIPPA